MTSRSRLLTSTFLVLGAVALLAVAPSSFAQEQAKEQGKPPMHMHKIDMMHATDTEVASEYKSEATQLREKSEAHRKAATMYRARGSTGKANYASVAKHCDKLAQFYEDAAKEAEGVASELAK
jgi:hypothetical protein